ncbi:poly(A)-specific ribonuclease PARN-like [Melitaea cinxia]|uniref:poly(A)-specific ribonuclease PARN-like n=1 Tax=Melitaea cinxia TaxID=113334 RepID=UPI001E26FCAE|nr:poly(A)-specific ribonuclease PARN-like [Melitaea cinxia]
MEVTRKNFKETLPLISASIDKADFLVIDTEFTGLINGRDVSIFDTPQEYYTTLLNGASDFLLIQYGLCAFYWDDLEKNYKNDAYNFYLFPRGRPGPEKMFLCQSSSLDFLASQGFDFNKLIKEGISYMTEPIETRLRENLTERQNRILNSENDAITIPEEHRNQIEDICKKVREFLKDGTEEEIEIDKCNAFVRRLLFQELGSRFKNEAFVETKVLENKDRVLKVSRLTSPNDSKARDTQKKEKEWEEFEDAVGFSKVARMISQSEKLVIGHNMLLDLLHTLNHFFQPLPSDYESFKEFAHCMFPRLLDTKYLSSLPPFKDKVNSSVLHHLLTTLSEPPFSLSKVECAAGRGYTRSDAKAHEAGYDAYVTGLCFLAMQAHLARMRGESCARVPAPDSPLLKPFLNKLFLSRTAHQDSPYINLTGPEPTPARDHVFHLTFPKDWQRNDINHLFSAFGQITVQFLDETSALVALTRRDLAKTVTRAFASNNRISIVPYVKYKLLTSKPGSQHHTDRREESSEKHMKYSTDNALARRGIVSESNAPRSPEKSRERSNSVSLTETQKARKRSSSGVFKIEEVTPPPPKKADLINKSDQTRNTTEVISNGRRKHKDCAKETPAEKRKETATEKRKETTEKRKDISIEKRKETNNVVKRFDSDSKVECVTAFKEIDNWD